MEGDGVCKESNAVLLFPFNRWGFETQREQVITQSFHPGSDKAEIETEILLYPNAAFFLFSKGLPASSESTSVVSLF